MRTRAKKKHVAGDRARRENVPGHILSCVRARQNFACLVVIFMEFEYNKSVIIKHKTPIKM